MKDMSRSTDELIELFIEKDYLLGMGKGNLAKRFKRSKDEIVKIKAEARLIIRNNAKTSVVEQPKGKLLKRWGKEGNWSESYKFEDSKDDSLLEFKNTFLKEISSLGSDIKSFDTSRRSNNKLIEINLPDYHFGKIDGQTIEQQADRFVKAGLELYNQAKDDSISHILLPIGNDFFNSEVTSTTHKGTPQQNNAEFHKVFSLGWGAVIRLINQLSKDVKVDIVIVPGNHDTDATVMLGEVLIAYYHNDNNVSVDGGAEQVKYYKFGKNLFLYNHGDKIKGPDLALRMAVDKPMEFANSKYRFIKLGHFHKNIVLDQIMGIDIEYMPSLCSADKWHRDNNYLSQPKSYATVYDKQLGKRSTFNVYIDNV